MSTITEKQISFITSLAYKTGAYADGEGMVVGMTAYPRLDLEAALEGVCDRREASKIIEVLLAAPVVIDENAATPRQVAYIKSLAAAAGREVEAAGLSKQEASALIDELLSAQKAA